MAWTAPRTWVTGEILTSTLLNTHLRDQLLFIASQGSDLVAAATITPTNEFHRVTGGTTITTITAGVQAGNEFMAYFTGAPLIQNAAGNVKTLSGADRQIQAGEIVTFIWDGTSWRETGALSGAWRAAKTAVKDVNTTVAATDLFNGEFTIPANLMGTSRILRGAAFGDWLNNTGGALGPGRLQLILGGTTAIDTGAAGNTYAASATRGGWLIQFQLFNQGAANVQFGWMRATFTGPGALTTGIGGPYNFQSQNNMHEVFEVTNGTLAVDTTAARTLVMNIINPSASASFSTRLQGALLELA